MNQRLPRLYAITDRTISGLSHTEMTQRLLDAGVRLIQIRDKQASSRDFYEEALACVQLARRVDARIIVNDRVDIALAVGAGGVHVGQTDLESAVVREIVGDRMLIGWSTHSVADAASGNALPVDYVAIGPVFHTTSKDNPDPVVGLDMVCDARSVLRKPLVAIGGITPSNVAAVFEAGADSVAVISALWTAPDLGAAVRSLLQS